MSLNRAVLVLNASYEPINITSARRAFTLLLKEKAVVEEVSAYTIRTGKMVLPVPSVIRTTEYRRIPRAARAVSRKGILLRDANICQYCERRFQPGNLTMDHVNPRSRGGLNSWENLVAACFRCNNKKGDRTPSEAGMKLLRTPRAVSIHAKNRMLAGSVENGQWDRYLFC